MKHVSLSNDRHYVRNVYVTHSNSDELGLSPNLADLIKRSMERLDPEFVVPKSATGISFTLISDVCMEVHVIDTSYYKHFPLSTHNDVLASILRVVTRHAQTTTEQRDWIFNQICNVASKPVSRFPIFEIARKGSVTIILSVTGCLHGPLYGLSFNTVLGDV